MAIHLLAPIRPPCGKSLHPKDAQTMCRIKKIDCNFVLRRKKYLTCFQRWQTPYGENDLLLATLFMLYLYQLLCAHEEKWRTYIILHHREAWL